MQSLTEYIRGKAEDVEAAIKSSLTTAIITHRNADVDAIASAYIANEIARKIGSKTLILVPEGPSRLSKEVLERLGVENLVYSGGVSAVDAVIVVDSANPAQLGEYALLYDTAKYRIVVDHHQGNNLASKATLAFIYPSASSTTEICVEIAEALNVRIPPKIATLGLAGIIYDSKRFIHAIGLTFHSTTKLIGWGGDYARALKAVHQKQDRGDLSERIAKLKALSRLTVARACRDILIAVTYIGSHESLIARTLVDLGADVAVVATARDSEKRVSIRVSEQAFQAGIKASTIALYIADKLGGEGGGHDYAAMAHISLEGGADDLAAILSKSLPGKIARMCVEGMKG